LIKFFKKSAYLNAPVAKAAQVAHLALETGQEFNVIAQIINMMIV
jgi:hypothetical protein